MTLDAFILVGVVLLFWQSQVSARHLAHIEKRLIRLQRWVEMHAEPAPQLTDEEIDEKHENPFNKREDVHRWIRGEDRRRRRTSLAQFVKALRADTDEEDDFELKRRRRRQADELERGEEV